MTPLFKKLNLGDAQVVHVLNAPASFEPEIAALTGLQVKRAAVGKVSFALAFEVTRDLLWGTVCARGGWLVPARGRSTWLLGGTSF